MDLTEGNVWWYYGIGQSNAWRVAKHNIQNENQFSPPPPWPQGSSYKQNIIQFARNERIFPLIISVTTLVEPGLRKVMVDNDNDVNPASFAAS